MKKTNSTLLLLPAALGVLLASVPVRAADTILHNFTGGSSDGMAPQGSLTLAGSKLYGMTYHGGSANRGTAFSMNTDGGGFTLLHSFTNGFGEGSDPYGSLTLSGLRLYGMTFRAGNSGGTAFSMNTDGTGYTVLHSFIGGPNDGVYPYGSLTLSGSKLYGMSNQGGGIGNFGFGSGTVFSMNTDGTGFTLLQRFADNPDGARPHGDLTLSSDGSTLYGMTGVGGTTGDGVVFSESTVPEPTSAALLALGLPALLAFRRRRA